MCCLKALLLFLSCTTMLRFVMMYCISTDCTSCFVLLVILFSVVPVESSTSMYLRLLLPLHTVPFERSLLITFVMCVLSLLSLATLYFWAIHAAIFALLVSLPVMTKALNTLSVVKSVKLLMLAMIVEQFVLYCEVMLRRIF